MPGRVLVAMSGGVDSSVAALLMQRAGFEVVGMTALLFGDASASGPCCGKEGACAAKSVCDTMGIEHHWVDMSELFERQVIDRFLDAYEAGRTPNPCSDCNRFIKFEAFFGLAEKLGCDVLATGHYARVEQGALMTAADPNKDQSYFLACIPPEKLARIQFPLGGLTKPEVRAIAAEAGLPTASRRESQDVCFMANGAGIAELLGWHRGREPQPGRIVDDSGRELGLHRGIEHYTIGQRRGLGLGGGTEGLSVQVLDPATNTVVVAPPERYPVAALHLSDFTDMAPGLWREGEVIEARSRYRQQPWQGMAHKVADGCATVMPSSTLFSAARGQWCVGFRGETVLFGGIIDSIEYAC